ncbi:MAG TPA: hypothetical protein VLL49_01215, partial [Anaerolineales bacterium]|nr:hypothetical protein [Anaerolineales bacterium]
MSLLSARCAQFTAGAGPMQALDQFGLDNAGAKGVHARLSRGHWPRGLEMNMKTTALILLLALVTFGC